MAPGQDLADPAETRPVWCDKPHALGMDCQAFLEFCQTRETDLE